MSIFHLKSYREIVQQKIRENSLHKGYKAYLSKRMKIQTSHFSQVMAGKIDLNPDQGAKLCDEWMFTEGEADYFLNLIYLERATTTSLKKRIKKHLDSLNQLNGVATPSRTSDSGRTVDNLPFYSNWIYPALLAVLKLNSKAKDQDIARRLEVPVSIARKSLQTLENLRLIENVQGDWQISSTFSHTAREAHGMLHSELRQKAHQQYLEGNTEMLRYASVNVVPTAKFNRMRSYIQKFFNEFQSDAAEETAGNSEIIVMNLDFFRIGRPEAKPD